MVEGVEVTAVTAAVALAEMMEANVLIDAVALVVTRGQR